MASGKLITFPITISVQTFFIYSFFFSFVFLCEYKNYQRDVFRVVLQKSFYDNPTCSWGCLKVVAMAYLPIMMSHVFTEPQRGQQ